MFNRYRRCCCQNDYNPEVIETLCNNVGATAEFAQTANCSSNCNNNCGCKYGRNNDSILIVAIVDLKNQIIHSQLILCLHKVMCQFKK